MTEVTDTTTDPDIDPDMVVDNRGRGCASGIVRVQKALEDLDDGSILVVKSTDKRARTEYPQLAEQTPHELIAITKDRTGLLRTEYITYLRIHET